MIDLILTIAVISLIVVPLLNRADTISSQLQSGLSETDICSQIADRIPEPTFDTPPISYGHFGLVDNLPEADTVCKTGPQNHEISIRILLFDDISRPNEIHEDEIAWMTYVHPEIGESATIFTIVTNTHLRSEELWRVVSFTRCHALVFIKVSADVSDDLISEYAREVDEKAVKEIACR